LGKIDRIKEDIGWLKLIFGIVVATELSLIGWLVSNYENAKFTMVLFCTVIIIGLGVAIVFINRIAYKKIDQLEEL